MNQNLVRRTPKPVNTWQEWEGLPVSSSDSTTIATSDVRYTTHTTNDGTSVCYMIDSSSLWEPNVIRSGDPYEVEEALRYERYNRYLDKLLRRNVTFLEERR